ncbi:MAG: S8 family serine peptidase [Anaerolineales bacterium]
MKISSRPTLYIFAAAVLFMTTVFAPGYHSVAARSDTRPAAQPNAQNNETAVPTNQLIIKYKTNADLKGANVPSGNDRMQMLSDAIDIPVEYFRVMSGDAHVLRLPARLPVNEVMEIARTIAALPDIEYAEPDRIMYPLLTPNDSQYGNQWHYFETYSINAPAAWDITMGSNSIKIAVIDTGITDHADLAGRWVGGYDFIADVATANDGGGRDNDPHDPGNWITPAESSSGPLAGCPVTNSSWHGTHVAGTIGAASNNNSGVAGINWVSQIVPVRVLGKCGGFISDIADGMRWAAGLPVSGVPTNNNPARVLNISLGGPGVCSATYQNAINAINAAGAIVVVAAGNNGSNLNTNSFQPGNCTGIITVAATDRGGDKAFYSNFGTTVEISAPGGETSPTLTDGVLSTVNTGTTVPVADTYGYKSGTSMAAPHVTGVVSLILSLDPTLSFAEVFQILQSTSQDFPAGSSCNQSICGSGIVDAAGAVNAVGVLPPTATHTLTFTATSTATPSQTPTKTNTPTATRTPSATATSSQTPTKTYTPTATVTNTPAATHTSAATATRTSTYTPTATTTITSGATHTSTATATSTVTSTKTPFTTTFGDVSTEHMFYQYIEAFYKAGITVGCSHSPKMYCPDNLVTRGEMAVFIERAMGNFSPNPSPADMFTDVVAGNPFKPFIEEFYNDGITAGCTLSPLQYCPQNNVTRGEMAVFIERAMGDFSPNPSPTDMFTDVQAGHPFKPFIEELYNDGITAGCTLSPLQYCPQNNVTRGQMAVFIVRAFNIPLP